MPADPRTFLNLNRQAQLAAVATMSPDDVLDLMRELGRLAHVESPNEIVQRSDGSDEFEFGDVELGFGFEFKAED